MSFRIFDGNWIELRRPDCEEVDLHFGKRRGGGQFDYLNAMSEVEERVIAELREAQRTGRAYVLFVHGWSTSRPGRMTTRSVVRSFMRSKDATPLIQRRECLQHRTAFLAKVRHCI